MKIHIEENVKKFILSLQKSTISKIFRTIDLLEDFGHNLKFPHSKKVKKNIFELRIRGQQEVRIFYAFHKNEAVLLHGFVKKSQKISQHELKLAEKQCRLLN